MRDRKVDLTRRDVLENFRAYGLPSPDLIRMDNHLFHRHFRSLRPQIAPKDRTGEAPAYCTLGRSGQGRAGQGRAGQGIYYIFIFIFIFIHDIQTSHSKCGVAVLYTEVVRRLEYNNPESYPLVCMYVCMYIELNTARKRLHVSVSVCLCVRAESAVGGGSRLGLGFEVGAGDAEGFFDVIVTDPPYGIRAGAKKSGQANSA